MRFYVSVGRRGILFRIGMLATGTLGTLTYWHARRRRSVTSTVPSLPAQHSGVHRRRSLHITPPPTSVS
jgi:hypothetical protein